MINIADSPFIISSELNDKILLKGVDISSDLMLQWMLQFIGFFAGTYGVEICKTLAANLKLLS